MKCRISNAQYFPVLAIVVVLVGALATIPAHAQQYPTKPVHVLVGNAAGGGTDIMARAVGQKLSQALGSQFIVDNRPGANANLAAQLASKAPADGYTLLMITVQQAISKTLYRKLGYDIERDFVPVIQVSSVPQFVIVTPSLPVKTLKELITLAKSRPGELTFASSGEGSPEHIAGELLKSMAGIDMIQVPYQGGNPAALAVISGETAVGFNTSPVAVPLVKSGRVKVLAVTADKRSLTLPDVPTVAESGLPGYAMGTWFGIVGPAGMHHDIIILLNGEIDRILKLPDVREHLATMGADPVGGTPEQFENLIRSEVAKFARLAKERHLSID
jgi:tripartite-type tricarboxylate transporter receptor subunit TctC